MTNRGKSRDNMIYYQMMYLSFWLARNFNKKTLFATLNNEYIYKQFCEWFPHLVLTKLPEGVKVEFPCCNK